MYTYPLYLKQIMSVKLWGNMVVFPSMMTNKTTPTALCHQQYKTCAEIQLFPLYQNYIHIFIVHQRTKNVSLEAPAAGKSETTNCDIIFMPVLVISFKLHMRRDCYPSHIRESVWDRGTSRDRSHWDCKSTKQLEKFLQDAGSTNLLINLEGTERTFLCIGWV